MSSEITATCTVGIVPGHASEIEDKKAGERGSSPTGSIHEVVRAEDSECTHSNSEAGEHLISRRPEIRTRPLRLRSPHHAAVFLGSRFVIYCQRRILMVLWGKLTKIFHSNILSYCYNPQVLETVDLTLVSLDAASHVEDAFRNELGSFLRLHGHEAVWSNSGHGINIVLHQPEQRLDPTRLLRVLSTYEITGGPTIMVFLIPQNPAIKDTLMSARDMTDDTSFRKLERSVHTTVDWYFWHMFTSQKQVDILKMCNEPACEVILNAVRAVQPDQLPSYSLPGPGTSAHHPTPPSSGGRSDFVAAGEDSALRNFRGLPSQSSSFFRDTHNFRGRFENGWGPI